MAAHRTIPIALMLATALLTACEPDATPTATATAHPFIPPVTFVCGPDGGADAQSALRLVVAFKDEHAEVTLPDGTRLTLPQQRAASGFWYATPRHELRGKGQEATWTVGRAAPLACRAEPPPY
ncbi:MliC family protein [Parapedomonas caeni]